MVIEPSPLRRCLVSMAKILLTTFLILSTAAAVTAQSEFAPRTMLKPRIPGPYTIAPNVDARTGYDTLGSRAGINMVYHPDFKADTAVLLRIEGQTFFDIMDKFSTQTGNFWFAWDSKTVIVAPDNLATRRDLEPLVFKIFYLNPSLRTEDVANIANTLRVQQQLRSFWVAPSAKAITIHGNASTIETAERLISELSLQALPLNASSPLRFAAIDRSLVWLADNGTVRRIVPATQAHMEKMLAGSVAIDMNASPASIYENLVIRAGMNVIVDRAVREKPASRFHVEGVDLINALDLLALQTATFWQPINDSTIHVMADTQQNRRDREVMQVKVIYLPNTATTTTLNETLNVLRTAFSMRGIYQGEKQKAIVVKDTPLRLFVAEKAITDLTKQLGKLTSITFSSGNNLIAENGWLLTNAANARDKLDVQLRSRTTIRLNETPRAAFTALADLAGLKLAENSTIREEAEVPFNLYNVDILDALDLFAWQTRHFIQVIDEHTIRVVPDTLQVRRELEPMIDRTIPPADPEAAPGLLNILRTAFALRQIQLDEKNAFVIRDTAGNVALAEKLIELLGTAGPPGPADSAAPNR